jgi:maleate isomerase
VPYDVTAKLVRETNTDDAAAVFISCTNLPTYDVISTLEAELGKPVLTANQVTIWSALTIIGRKGVGPGQRLMES